MKDLWTIEDCLEILTGLSSYNTKKQILLERSDTGIMVSIAKQVFKGTALTDRQCDLVINKINAYKDSLPDEINVDELLEKKTLRLPIRSVDRSAWIKKVIMDDKEYIGIRFLFSKKTISLIRNIEHTLIGQIKYDNKIHHVPFNEHNLYTILNVFKEKKFEIADELKHLYKKIDAVKQSRNEHIPALIIENNTPVLKNCSSELLTMIENELGKLNYENVVQYVNRSSKYCIPDIDENVTNLLKNTYSSLQQQFIFNNERVNWLSNEKYSLNEIAESVGLVNRFPILLILEDDDTAVDNLHNFRTAFSGLVSNSNYSVLFRQEGNAEFNQYIKQNTLNNYFDNTTKVLVIQSKSIPKLLLKQEWYPNLVFSMSENINRGKLQVYISRYDMLYYYTKKQPMTQGIYFD